MTPPAAARLLIAAALAIPPAAAGCNWFGKTAVNSHGVPVQSEPAVASEDRPIQSADAELGESGESGDFEDWGG